MVKVIFYKIKELLLKERIRSLWSKFFSLREVLILKRDVIVEKHCFIQWSPFDVRTFFNAFVPYHLENIISHAI